MTYDNSRNVLLVFTKIALSIEKQKTDDVAKTFGSLVQYDSILSKSAELVLRHIN